jgi:tRNA pseudouridine55 synthase
MENGSANDFAGILNIDKPTGMTSHDVVNRVRRLSGQRRVGHAGTLDPLATGVLVICVGWATRLSEYLMVGTKCYRATARLGVTTDTYDSEGSVILEVDPGNVLLAGVNRALETFEGEIEQIPPMYSAVKQKGTPLYKLARRGEVVTRLPRSVQVYALSVVDWNPPDVVFEVTCSKGTYIRSLVHDVGEKLGCGAHLTALTRLSSGPFRLTEAFSLEELASAFEQRRARTLLYPVQKALEGFDVLTVGDETAGRIRHGQAVEGPLPEHASFGLALSSWGEPLAVLKYDGSTGRWQPNKVFG